jgi:hypothetical protein
MATISSPIGRTPRNAGAGANTYKKGGIIKVAGVMKSGGTKYQDKGAVTTKPLLSPAKIAVPGSSKPATPASRAKFIEMLKTGKPSTPKPKVKTKSNG